MTDSTLEYCGKSKPARGVRAGNRTVVSGFLSSGELFHGFSDLGLMFSLSSGLLEVEMALDGKYTGCDIPSFFSHGFGVVPGVVDSLGAFEPRVWALGVVVSESEKA